MGGPIEDMLRPLRRFADFRGRAGRREYWLFTLLYVMLVVVIGGLGMAFGWQPLDDAGKWRLVAPGATAPLIDTIVSGALLLVTLALLVPHLAVQVRRFHDRDTSARMLFWHFVPYIGSAVLIIALTRPGTIGRNRYGADPTDPLDDYGFVIGTRSGPGERWGQ